MESATRVLAVRHGETAWNVETRIQGQLNICLNDKGRWQAERVAQALADEELHAVYASDLVRAYDTAVVIGRAAGGLRVQREFGLRERSFGVFEGRTWAEIERDFPDHSARWRAREPEYGPSGGETLARFYNRVVSSAGEIAARHPGQTIVLVAHGGVLDCLYRAAARVELQAPRSWQLGNAAVNRLLYSEEGFTLVGWGDTSHLDGAEHDEFSDGGGADRVGHAA